MTKIQLRRGTAAQWVAANPILDEGEPGYETDTGRQKTGNGTTAWLELEYLLGSNGVALQIEETTGDLSLLQTQAKTTLVAAINEAATTGGTSGPVEISAATEGAAGVGEIATVQEVRDGTDHSNKFATPAGVSQAIADKVGTLTSLSTAAKTTAVAAINELQTEIGDVSTLNTTVKTSLVAAINEVKSTAGTGTGTGLDAEGVRDAVKAALRGIEGITVNDAPGDDAADTLTIGINTFSMEAVSGLVAALDNLAPKAQPAFVGPATVDGYVIITEEDMAGYVRSAPGAPPLTLYRGGLDTPSGGAGDVVLSTDAGTPTTSGSIPPPGLDLAGGVVGSTVADAAIGRPPLSTATEADGSVMVVPAGTRIAVRAKVYASRIDRVYWQIGEGSTASVTGTIAICRASNGEILAQNTAQALTPGTVTAGTGNTQSWSLSAPITGLTPGDEVVIVLQHTTGTVRYAASGISGLLNVSALRTFSAGSGELHRSGALNPAPALPLSSPLDFSATAGWSKRLAPIFILGRTA